MPAQDSTVDVRGSDVRVLRGGSGPPLVYLDVVTSESASWLTIHDLLAAKFDVVVPVLPVGSFELKAPRSVRDLAILARDLIDSLHLSEVTIVASSLGGWVAADLATSCSHGLAGLALLGALGLQPAPGAAPDVFAVSSEDAASLFFRRPGDVPPEHAGGISVAEQVRGRVKLMARLGWNPYLHDPLLASRLHRIDVATSVIWGAEDRLLPSAQAERFAGAIPGAQSRIIAGAGHLVAIDRPAETVAAIVEGR